MLCFWDCILVAQLVIILIDSVCNINSVNENSSTFQFSVILHKRYYLGLTSLLASIREWEILPECRCSGLLMASILANPCSIFTASGVQCSALLVGDAPNIYIYIYIFFFFETKIYLYWIHRIRVTKFYTTCQVLQLFSFT